MAKLYVNDKMPDFSFTTPFRKDVRLSEVTKGRKLALVFLRYYGCTLCQFDLAQYAKNYDKIKATGGELLVVLQSDPDLLREELGGTEVFPFEIICDPEEKLYREFEILPATCQEEMVGPTTMAKIEKAMSGGFSHGRYEGEELQLPASFVLQPDLTITFAQYAKAVDDIPDADQLVELLQK